MAQNFTIDCYTKAVTCELQVIVLYLFLEFLVLYPHLCIDLKGS